MSLFKENIIAKLEKLCSPPRNLRAGNKSPPLFLKKFFCTDDLSTARKIFIERPELILSEEEQILKQVNTELFAKNWNKLTSDKYILDIAKNGLRLDFKEFPKNRQYQFRTLKNDELDIVEAEVDKRLRKQVICESKRGKKSNVLTRNKKDGGKLMILNLKQINTHIKYRHFKMESIMKIIDIVRRNVYIPSTDLKDPFYPIPIHPEHQKYLKFVVLSKIYQYKGMPNGYGHPCTSLQKHPKFPFHTYEVKGLYQWYLLTIHTSSKILIKYVITTLKAQLKIELLQNLGFTIHSPISLLTPTQRITFLGFVLDSVQ